MKSAGESHPHLNRGDVQSWVRLFFPTVPSVNVPSLGAGDTQVLAGQGTGDPIVAEVSTFGFTAMQMQLDGDDFHWLIDTPCNLDTSAPVKVSVVWSTDSVTATESGLWKVLYNVQAFGSALAAAATALDTVIVDDLCVGVAYALQKTEAGIINPGKLDPSKMIHILAELDTSTGLNPAADAVFLHGIMIEYLRKLL